MNKKIILASTSPRRKGLLQQIGLKFEIVPSDFKEDMTLDMEPKDLVMSIAEGKADDVAEKESDAVIIGVDTFLEYEGEILGKPKDDEETFQRLKKMSDKYINVYSGICIIDLYDDKKIKDYEISKIKLKELTDKEIKDYIFTGEPKGKAGSIAIQERGAIFVEKIDGCYSNIVGLPLHNLYKNLQKLDINIFEY